MPLSRVRKKNRLRAEPENLVRANLRYAAPENTAVVSTVISSAWSYSMLLVYLFYVPFLISIIPSLPVTW